MFIFVKILRYSREAPVRKSLLNKFVGRKACKFIKKRPQHRCFPVNIVNLRTPILKNICIYGCFWSDFSKRFFRTFFLLSHFQNHPDLVILQKYQPLSNHSFKHNLVYILALNLTAKLFFEPWFCMFIINGYGRKSKRLQSLDFLFNFLVTYFDIITS